MPTKLMQAALAAALLAASTPACQAAVPKVGDVAPDFELETVDRVKVHLSELKGQVVILNFWATWCGPCKAELPTLDAYYRARRDMGLRVFAVTTEDSLPLFRLKPLFKAMAIPAVWHIRGPYAVLGGVPTNYVIDRAGIVRYARAAAFDLDALNALLVPLLNEKPPATMAAR